MNWLFCDLDGTLANSIPAMYAVLGKFLREYGIDPTQSLFDDLNGRSLREIVTVLRERYTLAPSVGDLQARYEQLIEEAYGADVSAMPGASDLLEHAATAGYQLMLVTSGNSGPARRFIEHNGWTGMFAGFVFGEEVKEAKPSPAIYQLALARSEAATGRVAVLEDSPAGVTSAKAAGLFVVALQGTCSANVLTDSGADVVVNSLGEVLARLSEKAQP